MRMLATKLDRLSFAEGRDLANARLSAAWSVTPEHTGMPLLDVFTEVDEVSLGRRP